jgi:putative endonuclease
MNGEWHVYLLECADGTYYCGVTKDVIRRMEQHNGKLPGGAKYTRTRQPVKLLAACDCASKSAAYRLEYTVKSQTRAQKLAILQAWANSASA